MSLRQLKHFYILNNSLCLAIQCQTLQLENEKNTFTEEQNFFLLAQLTYEMLINIYSLRMMLSTKYCGHYLICTATSISQIAIKKASLMFSQPKRNEGSPHR